MKRIELHHVYPGDSVSFTYSMSLLIEAKLKGCDIIRIASNKLVSDPLLLNEIIDWLIKNHKDEFKLKESE